MPRILWYDLTSQRYKSDAGEERTMLGKTHFAVGIAVGLIVGQPQTIPALLAGIGVSALGGVLPDIDSGTSTAHKDADRIMAVSAAAAGSAAVAEAVFHVGIYSRLLQNGTIARAVLAVRLFLLVCFFGKEQPHRSFMHSLLALLFLTACVSQIFPDAVQYFAAGFLSHLVIDLLNRRRVHLFYPLGRGVCLNLCSSRGLVNQILFLSGGLASILLVLTALPIREALSALLAG